MKRIYMCPAVQVVASEPEEMICASGEITDIVGVDGLDVSANPTDAIIDIGEARIDAMSLLNI